MPYYLLHAGTSLQKMSVTGNIKTLTLPGAETVSSSVRARFAMLDNVVVVVNAPSVNMQISGADYTVRVLNITGPGTSTCSASASSAGAPRGTYRYRYTYCVTSGSTLFSESPWSDASEPVTVDSQQISVTGITTSSNADVTARKLYRTTNGGAEYYLVATIANNTASTYTDNSSDYDLALLAVTEPKGNPPGVDSTDRLRVITAWKDRLWASPANDPDRIYFSQNRIPSSWLEDDYLTAKPVGEDEIGVVGFMARRDELVIAKRRRLMKIIGDARDNFQMILIAEGIGAMSQEAMIVIRDTAYFLAEDGFYEYGPKGLINLSRDQVHPWFTTDDYFNRAKFVDAFAYWNPFYDVIHLHLANAGSTSLDRWVTFDLARRLWLGPHLTAAFTPTIGGLLDDANGFPLPALGSSSGSVYGQNASTASDAGTAIAFDVYTKWHGMATPDIHKYMGELAILTKVETTGSLTITPRVGDLGASTSAAFTHNLTLGRERLGRLGLGRFVQLQFTQNDNNQGVEIYGYEIPFHELGRR